MHGGVVRKKDEDEAPKKAYILGNMGIYRQKKNCLQREGKSHRTRKAWCWEINNISNDFCMEFQQNVIIHQQRFFLFFFFFSLGISCFHPTTSQEIELIKHNQEGLFFSEPLPMPQPQQDQIHPHFGTLAGQRTGKFSGEKGE